MDNFSIKEAILERLLLMPGWKTNRRIVVFESDDWGMIRMASKEAFNYLLKKGFPVEKCPYNTNDTLESNTDLQLLFEVLDSVKDKNGNPAILTANNIVANPDFRKIKDNDFQEYFYEPFTKTLTRYPNREYVIDLYREGIEKKLFRPQFHGREHLNVANWMTALQNKNKGALMAFEQQMFSAHFKAQGASCRNEFLDAFGSGQNSKEINFAAIISEGADLFYKIHGYHAYSFIAPCYTWPVNINRHLKKNGFLFLQGGRVQKIPSAEKKIGFEKKYHYTGQKNNLGQIYLVRNASFEVAENPNKDWVNSCMREIALAFKFKKPAIVSTHRVNFIGALNPKNRSHTLKLFKQLLSQVTKTWPDVEFMSSDELGQIIKNEN